MSAACPFAKLSLGGASKTLDDICKKVETETEQLNEGTEHKNAESQTGGPVGKCPYNYDSPLPAGKCPYGYDSGSFKIGPLSCVFCRALLFDCCKCIPCGHMYCRSCISRFNDCLICGADIVGTESDPDLQGMVDRFIEGHARVKRPISHSSENGRELEQQQMNVTYEDVSLARGSFLLQQAMRAFQAQNLESAKARLTICENDIREELARNGSSAEIWSQLGAVLGMLGDCCRAMGNVETAAEYYEESIGMLSNLANVDVEVVHALSVSLNKLGDLKYYADDLRAARSFYARALDVRKKALTDYTKLSSQVLDIAVSLSKVADVDRILGSDKIALEGFQEALKTLEGLSSIDSEPTLERRRASILTFLHSQLSEGAE